MTVAACIALCLPGAAKAARPAWMPAVFHRIAVCETHADPSWHTRDYQGMFGMFRGTWDDYKPAGYPADADDATPRQQLVVARIVARKFGLSAWGCWRQHRWVREGS
jgi:hypothetical protein